MKNVGLIGLVVVLLVVFGGYISYKATAPETEDAEIITEEEGRTAGSQFIQMKPDSLPPVSSEETGGLEQPVGKAAQKDEEKNGVVSGAQDENQQASNEGAVEERKTPVDQPGMVISMTDTGFFPSTVTVKAGTKVSFVNDGQALHWPASDPHPTHEGLAGFDAGAGVATGGVYEYMFDKAGEWGFHDHLDTNQTGKIVVE